MGYASLTDKELKNYYEKYCFLNNMIEEEIDSKVAVNIFDRKYNFSF